MVFCFRFVDLVIDMASNNLEQQKEQQGNQPKIDEGMDVMYNERQLKRLELMKNAVRFFLFNCVSTF